MLECQVTSFSVGASWSHDGGHSILTQCFSGGICTDTGSGNYQYTSDSNGINVTIVSLSESEVGITWTCSHSTFNASYIVPSKCFYEIHIFFVEYNMFIILLHGGHMCSTVYFTNILLRSSIWKML